MAGDVTPSGKLAATWARRYEDYPGAAGFSYLNGDLVNEVYEEGIYTGYRWFDSFSKETAFGFGHGLSYTGFAISVTELSENAKEAEVRVTAAVTNLGDTYSGREVVQAYVSCPQTGQPKEFRWLAGFAKTKVLAPGETEEVVIHAAKEILKSGNIGLVLCDIEMPQGRGLDLLSWIREEKLDVEVLIITCHPEFDYAQKAMALSSVDYLLKPVMPDALAASLAKALERCESWESANQFEKNKDQMRAAFFRDLMEGRKDLPEEEMNGSMRRLDIPYGCGERMLGLYFRLDRSLKDDSDTSVWSDKVMFLNMAEEILLDYQEKPWTYFPENNAFFLAFPVKSIEGSVKSFCDGRVSRFLSVAERMLGLFIACFPGESVPFGVLREVCDILRKESRRVFVKSGEIVYRKLELPGGKVLPSLNMYEWRVMLENARPDRVWANIGAYLEELDRRRAVPREELYEVGNALGRAVEESFAALGKDTAEVMTLEVRDGLFMRGRCFIEDFENAAEALFQSLEAFFKGQSEEIIGRITRYIDTHVEEDMDRRSLSDQFGLSPDYLSRLFRAKTGQTLISYITKAKLSQCCLLFETTDCSVNRAAAQVGYTNFSYFSKLFHDEYGCTPQQYKKGLGEKWDTYYESPHRPEGDSIQGCTHASGTFIHSGALIRMRA